MTVSSHASANDSESLAAFTRPSTALGKPHLCVLRSERTNSLSSPPDLHLADLVDLLLELGTIVLLRSKFERAARLFASRNGSVQFVEDRFERGLELWRPIQSSTTSCGAAGIVHVVKAVAT